MTDTLAETTVLVTSGPTRADIDAVRYIGNRSSGRLGCRIATEALGRGARVILVAGPGSVVPTGLRPEERNRLRVEPVVTVAALLQTLKGILTDGTPPDAVVHAMAVLDYVPVDTAAQKTPSGREEWQLTLVPTPKVVRKIREWAPETFLVQFKLEVGITEDELRRAALESLRKNRADLVVANDLTRIRDEVHPALIIDPEGEVIARPGTKGEIGRSLCDVIERRFRG